MYEPLLTKVQLEATDLSVPSKTKQSNSHKCSVFSYILGRNTKQS